MEQQSSLFGNLANATVTHEVTVSWEFVGKLLALLLFAGLLNRLLNQ